VGAPVNGDRAYGKYQTMGANISLLDQGGTWICDDSRTVPQRSQGPGEGSGFEAFFLFRHVRACGGGLGLVFGLSAQRGKHGAAASRPSIHDYVAQVLSRMSGAGGAGSTLTIPSGWGLH